MGGRVAIATRRRAAALRENVGAPTFLRLTLACGALTLWAWKCFSRPTKKPLFNGPIESGRFRSKEDAVREALRQWEERERKRAEFLATIDDAKASLARGEGRPLNEQSMSELAEEVKNRGHARLGAEKQSQR